MKHLILIAFLGLSVFVSCDGRTTKKDALKEAITKFKDSVEPLEIVEYIPAEYCEIQTDTILSNGFIVKIKTYTDMNTSVIRKYEKDGHLIFNKVIDNNFFLEHKKIHLTPSSSIVNTGVIVDEALTSLEKNYVFLSTGYLFPDEKENNILYTLKVDTEGNYSLEQLNTFTKTI